MLTIPRYTSTGARHETEDTEDNQDIYGGGAQARDILNHNEWMLTSVEICRSLSIGMRSLQVSGLQELEPRESRMIYFIVILGTGH